jgi:hypothetical protein
MAARVINAPTEHHSTGHERIGDGIEVGNVLGRPHGRDLLEIIDDRHRRAATIVTSQLAIDNWHAY